MKSETMLGYDWGNPSPVILSAEETAHVPEPNRLVFDPYTTHYYSHHETAGFNPDINFTTASAAAAHHQIFPNLNTHITNFHSSPAYTSHTPPYPYSHHLEPAGSTGYMVVMKREPANGHECNAEFNGGLGLNLGWRTYFASSENDFVNRVYLGPKILEPGLVNFPKCQAEGCNADLTTAKHYHRRHKVCEFHSKAATVVAAGLTQRFCQQCSRFHLLSEFDNGKRSCRRRLADHNRRRRKSNQSNQENSQSQLHDSDAPNNSSCENLPRSSPNDSEPYSSSITTAISPPRINVELN